MNVDIFIRSLIILLLLASGQHTIGAAEGGVGAAFRPLHESWINRSEGERDG